MHTDNLGQMEAAIAARGAMTDEEDDLHTNNSSVLDTDIEGDIKQSQADIDDDDDDDDVGMTEEDDDEEDEDPPSQTSTATTSQSKSPTKGKRKAATRATDDEGDDDDEDEEMKDDTADEDEEEDEEEDDEEDDEKADDENGPATSAELTKIDLSDPKSMLRMIRSLSDEEARRHEQFRRSHFDRSAIKRVMATTIQECLSADKKMPVVTPVMAIIMAGMAKGFVGELTAEARRIMERNGETGPMEPRHLREAQRKYYNRRPLARGRNVKRLLR